MNTELLFAGLPASGKTTFIAALWHYVNSDADDKTLILESISGENQYLDDIATDWLKCSNVKRTRHSIKGTPTQMNLVSSSTRKQLTLNITDFAGEAFRQQFDFRAWSNEFSGLLDRTSGIVLFVNPDEPKNRPRFLRLQNELVRIFGGSIPTEVPKPQPWSFDFVPHQVRLVELLQFVAYYKPEKAPFKLSLIISAWDKVETGEVKITPENWLSKNLPLLHQYLISNKTTFLTSFFGVSAQGGDYKSEKTKLLSVSPAKRILIRGDTGLSNHIDVPLLWMTE